MSKKSKWFRVCVEGATIDGREISRQHLQEMADSYNPQTYSAQVNLEHYRGIVPGSSFDVLGKVLALRAQEDTIQIGGKDEKRVALYAQIEPLPALEAMLAKGQKLHTSVEILPDFAKSGKAGLFGLAVTDTPASLGTEPLKFSPLNGLGLRSPAIETAIELEASPAANQDTLTAFLSSLKEVFGGRPAEKAQEQAPPAKVEADGQGINQAAFTAALETFGKGITDTLTKLSSDVAATNTAVDARLKTLEDAAEKLTSPTHKTRPLATGAGGGSLADC